DVDSLPRILLQQTLDLEVPPRRGHDCAELERPVRSDLRRGALPRHDLAPRPVRAVVARDRDAGRPTFDRTHGTAVLVDHAPADPGALQEGDVPEVLDAAGFDPAPASPGGHPALRHEVQRELVR